MQEALVNVTGSSVILLAHATFGGLGTLAALWVFVEALNAREENTKGIFIHGILHGGGGDRLEVEETLGVVMTPRLLHRLLMRQEGGRLGKEDREGAQTKVGHGIGGVLALAPVGQSGQCPAEVADKIVKARAAQAGSRRRKSALKGWR